MRRDGSTLSAVIRQAWESDRLRTLTRNSPLRASGAHVSIIGHISAEELRRELLTTDAASGFANRFLFVCACRSKQLPEGGNLRDDDWQALVPDIREALRFAKSLAREADAVGTLSRDDAARELWADVYGELSEGATGLLGAITSRGEAQVMRLAVIYAVLDCSPQIRVEHLRAALAVWYYCEASAHYLFGHALGDETADTLLSALQAHGSEGMTRTAIRDHFARHKSAADVERALSLLESLGRVKRVARSTGGRPAEIWRVASSDESTESDAVRSLKSLRTQREPSENGTDPVPHRRAEPCKCGGLVDDGTCIKCGKAAP
jgi:hypothetical protein